MNLKTWAKASRAPFFIAVIMPSVIGGAVAYYHGFFDVVRFLIVVLGMVLANAGTNFVNDYYDFRSGADVENRNRTPFSGGSPFLVEGALNPKRVLAAGLSCFSLAFTVAVYLAIATGPLVLLLAGLGGFIGFFYTAPPFRLGYVGVGEAATGLALGPLTILGVYYVMTGNIGLGPLVASIPVGALVATILYVNEVPDYEADSRAGKRHLVVVLGKAMAVRLLPVPFAIVYLSIILGVALGAMPRWSLLALLTFPLAASVIKTAAANYDCTARYIPAMSRTIANYFLTGALLAAGYLIPALID